MHEVNIFMLLNKIASSHRWLLFFQDTYWNPEEFPPSFFQGAWEGFWWAFVSMTTVGYVYGQDNLMFCHKPNCVIDVRETENGLQKQTAANAKIYD